MLAVQPNLTTPDFSPLLASLLKGVLLVIWSLAVARYILPRLFRSVAKAPELVLVSALAWCFFLASAASVIGLSREMGALIAGVSLSTFPYNLDVIAKATNIRDFFVTLFFVALGMQIPLPQPSLLLIALAASAFLMLSRIVVVPILYALRLGHRASLIPAINLAQISEFSIVIASIGYARGQIHADVVTVIVMMFALTSVTSTYMVAYNHSIQQRISWLLRRLRVPDLDTIGRVREEHEDVRHNSVILLGFFRDASSILQELERMRPPRGGARLRDLLVIDFNPNVIGELRRRGIRCVYGDVAHVDTLQHAHIAGARLVVSTITDDILRGTSNFRILKNVRHLNPSAHVVVATDHIPQALAFYQAGADFVYVPRLHSAREMARILQHGLSRGFGEVRREAIAALTQRHEVLA
jgi:hypothetical protein